MKSLTLILCFCLAGALGPLRAAGEAGDAPEGKLYLVRNHGKCGFIDHTGRVVIPLKYDAAGSFSEGLAPVRVGKLWGAIDRTGRMVITPQPHRIMGFLDGMSMIWGDPARTGMLCGFMDSQGKLVVPPRYKGIHRFEQDMAMVQGEGGWGFIDRRGTEIIPLKYQQYSFFFYTFSEGFCLMKNPEGHPVFVHRSGDVLALTDVEFAEPFKQGLAAASSNGYWGFLDTKGNWVIPPRYQKVRSFSEGRAWVRDDPGWGAVDPKGKNIIPPSFQDCHSFCEGLAWVRDEKGWGCVGLSGELRILCRFDEVKDFCSGRAWVKQGGRWGVIDRQGKWLVSPRFHSHANFEDGFALVNIGGTVPPSSCYAVSIEEGIGGRWGLIDTEGRWVIPARYSTVEFFDGDVGLFKEKGRWKYIDRRGKTLWAGDRGDNSPRS